MTPPWDWFAAPKPSFTRDPTQALVKEGFGMHQLNLRRAIQLGMLVLVSSSAASSSATAQTYTSTDTPLRIPPAGTTGQTISSINVTDSFAIADLDVNVDYNHTFNADLAATVTSPNGTSVQLFDGVGGATNAQNGGYRFDDDATGSFPAGFPATNQSYQPQQALSAFNGENAQGTWTLTMIDDLGGDIGTLNFWQLFFLSATPPTDASFADVLASASLLEIQATSQFIDLLADRLRGGVTTSARQYAMQMSQISASPQPYEQPIRLVSTAPSDSGIQQVSYHTNPVYHARKISKNSAWVSGYGAQGSVDNGFQYDFAGVAFGAQRQLDCFTAIGLAGNYYGADGSRGSGNVDLDTLGVALYGSRRLRSNMYLTGILGFSDGDYDTSRQTNTGLASGETDSDAFQSYFELGRTYRSRGWTLQPHVAFQYIGVDYDGYSETGASVSNLQIADDNVDSARGILGASVSRNLCILGGTLAPIYRIAYTHEFADTDQILVGQFAGANGLRIQGAELGRDFLDLGVGFGYAARCGVTLYADYDAQFTSEHDQHTGQGGMMFAW
ncbi:autotransporter domain-containing protein [Roseiconus lacunae]|uniref:autotransporter domain-containing protein n=1 Tax=Roseiconus lacunae TaxID=2605694 RepID=UPI001E5FA5F3|nr:autotransporter domain-containing protein [Roseiconus lacunae]